MKHNNLIIISALNFLILSFGGCNKTGISCTIPPDVAFSVEETFVSTGSPLQFTDESTNLPDKWLWDFGDGNTSTEQNPQHIYTDAGHFTVTLISGNDCGDGVIYIRTNLITVITNPDIDKVSDYEGKSYYTVKIGDQWWMAENLATNKFNNGNEIPLVTDMDTWSQLTTPAYCYHNNDSENNGVTYGALYNWYAIEIGNLCPTGWHVATEDDWQTLETTLGMHTNVLDDEGYRGGNEGMELKAASVDWEISSYYGTNSVGFTALQGGARDFYYSDPRLLGFSGLRAFAFFWTATESSQTSSWYRKLSYSDDGVGRYSYNKEYGLSVRCVKN